MTTDAHDIIRLHTTSSRRWCMSCKQHVTDPAQHLIDKLYLAGWLLVSTTQEEKAHG